jgi:organic hydroperoxide reductase OsmC/OhrA
VLVIKRIKVRYHLRAPEQLRATVERVHAMHHRFCPVYRSLAGCIEMTTEITMEERGGTSVEAAE